MELMAEVRSGELYLVASQRHDPSNSEGIFALLDFQHTAAIHTASGKLQTKNSLPTKIICASF